VMTAPPSYTKHVAVTARRNAGVAAPYLPPRSPASRAKRVGDGAIEGGGLMAVAPTESVSSCGLRANHFACMAKGSTSDWVHRLAKILGRLLEIPDQESPLDRGKLPKSPDRARARASVSIRATVAANRFFIGSFSEQFVSPGTPTSKSRPIALIRFETGQTVRGVAEPGISDRASAGAQFSGTENPAGERPHAGFRVGRSKPRCATACSRSS